jgi:hypothetical protein
MAQAGAAGRGCRAARPAVCRASKREGSDCAGRGTAAGGRSARAGQRSDGNPAGCARRRHRAATGAPANPFRPATGLRARCRSGNRPACRPVDARNPAAGGRSERSWRCDRADCGLASAAVAAEQCAAAWAPERRIHRHAAEPAAWASHSAIRDSRAAIASASAAPDHRATIASTSAIWGARTIAAACAARDRKAWSAATAPGGNKAAPAAAPGVGNETGTAPAAARRCS